jgi:two-component system, LytTR family, response regulator LytT
VNKLRAVLVDDVTSVRDDLKDILNRQHSDVEVVGEAENTSNAWEIIERDQNIDIVFLDIDIPTESERAGLDFAVNLNRLDNPPWVVFVSGESRHALEAHQLHPAHYLLKPLEDAAVEKALNWIRQQYPLRKKPQIRIEIKHKITNRDGSNDFGYAFINADEIVYIQKNNNAATLRIKLLQGDLLDGVYGTLVEWGAFGLQQVHNSSLVNPLHVQGLRPRPSQDKAFKVYFRTCADEVAVGERYLEKFREALLNSSANKPT